MEYIDLATHQGYLLLLLYQQNNQTYHLCDIPQRIRLFRRVCEAFIVHHRLKSHRFYTFVFNGKKVKFNIKSLFRQFKLQKLLSKAVKI